MKSTNLTTAVAVAALTFGIAGPRLAPENAELLSKSDIVIAADDGVTDDDAESAKMGEDSGDQNGAQDEMSDSDTKRIDQPERQDDGTMEDAGEE